MSGFQCLGWCFHALTEFNFRDPEDYYFGGFVFSNLIFVVCIIPILIDRFRFKLARHLLALASLHVFSLFVICVINSHLGDLGIGYYFWLGAFLILNLAFYLDQPAWSPDPALGNKTPAAKPPPITQ
jgi:uncharacterized membrane protein